MKPWLKKTLSNQQYELLARLKNKILPDLRYRLGQSPFLLIGLMVKLFPASSRVTVKSGINVVRKMDYSKRQILLSVDSDFEYRVRLHSCKKEPETVEWIETFFKAGDVLYDVGANVGAYSLLASKFFDGKVKVYAFEPAFQNFAQLCKNVALNGCQDDIVLLQIALSHETSMQVFNYRSLTSGTAVHALGDPVDVSGGIFTPVHTQATLAFRLDDLIRQFHFSVPNHIKIDVDGTEFSVLQGMEETLSNAALRSMLLELNNGIGQDRMILDYLSRKGFEIHSKHGFNMILVRAS